MAEIDHHEMLGADLSGHRLEFLVRQFQEVVEQTELVHQLERRRMYSVAAEIAEEIGVFLQHHDVDAGAGEEKAEHNSGRSAAGDATGGGDRGIGHLNSSELLCLAGSGN